MSHPNPTVECYATEELERLRNTAFAKFLSRQTEDMAIKYLWQCIREGDLDNMAWELWMLVHGNKRFSSSEIPGALKEMLNALKGT